MTGKDLLIGLGNISQKYYEEAENETLAEEKPRRLFRKPLLIAAIITLTALLVGCAVVYALRLQDMSIGQETYTQTFDDDGKYLEAPVEKTRDILTLFGHSGDRIQQATAEWFDFLETYDPDGALMDNNPDHPEIPNHYEYTYHCYTAEMAAKIDEIAAKYGLKLLEEWLPFQRWQSDIFLEESGIHSLLLPGSGAQMTELSGMFYPPYNFDIDMGVSTDQLDGGLWVTVLYSHKDYFPRDYPGGTDLSLYEQWDYTAPDGTQLLLALNNKGHGYVIAELEDAMMILSVDGNYSQSAYPTEEEIMTRDELEIAASLFDYTIQPQILDRDGVMAKLEASDAAYNAQHAYEPETYGSFSEVLLSQFITPDEKAQYTFFDLTGDGVEELLLDSFGYGTIDQWFTVLDGEVTFFWGNDVYLCEGRVLEQYMPDPEFGDYAQHYYLKPDSDTAWMDLDPETWGEFIEVLLLTDGQWSHAPEPYSEEETPITDEEAQAIMAKYPRIQLDWKPLMDYPISQEQTFREYLEEKDVRLSSEELHKLYQEKLRGMKDDMHYSHYRILDINGDGVDDLLLKGKNDPIIGNTDFYWTAMTYRYGTVARFASDFYLCEDGVLEHVETRHMGGPGVEVDGHQFRRWNGLESEPLEFVAYNKSTASWQGDWSNEIPLTEDEANTILAKYPRTDQGMRPISELLD
ncbi:MAG: hypothetical protein J6J12_02095 [Oscillospiraceae bacterium]|nr:hypothetical protein [Oscillospiraceae bacterium]